MTVFNYHNRSKETITCNLCGSMSYRVLANRMANGMSAKSCICRHCGLIYLNPRMTKEEYDRYYKYFYRFDRASVKRKEKTGTLQDNFNSAKKFGIALGAKIAPFIQRKGMMLDVGSSTGGVLKGLCVMFPAIQPIGVEPSVAEAEFANKNGIPTHIGLFENFARGAGDKKYENIACVRSLNHLLDPKAFFVWCRKNLVSGGSLILEVKNFRFQCRRAGNVSAGVQVDHPYMFTPETLKVLVESSGFRVIFMEDDETKTHKERMEQRKKGLSKHHIRLVAKMTKEDRAYPVIRPGTYWKLRMQLSQPYLMLYYGLKYSRRRGEIRANE